MKVQTTLSDFVAGVSRPTPKAKAITDSLDWCEMSEKFYPGVTAAKIKKLEAELKERGYRVDSSKVETLTYTKRTFVDIDALATAISYDLTVDDIVEYGPYRRRKDGSAGRAFNPSMMDMKRIAKTKAYTVFFKELHEDYPPSRYKFMLVQEHMESALRDELESRGLLRDDIIIMSGLFGDVVYLLPREKEEEVSA
jgi:hypothetical protein